MLGYSFGKIIEVSHTYIQASNPAPQAINLDMYGITGRLMGKRSHDCHCLHTGDVGLYANAL